jgi:LacI family transcriptional regulator
VYRSLPTLYDVCELSGVSSATVSRVFSGSARVTSATRKRVLAAARRLGYAPLHAGRALRSRRTQTIGAIFPEMAKHFYPEILCGIDEVASDSGFDVLASFVGKRRQRSELVDRLLGQGRVDALIIINLQSRNDLAPRVLSELPIILIDRGIPGTNLPAIGMDNVAGAKAMVDHLLEQGHRRIAVLTGPAGNFDSRQRLLGCKLALEKAGVRLEPELVWRGAFTFASGISVARELLRPGRRWPDAIFCLNDAMAIGLMGELRSKGVAVPGDIAVAGFDDVHEAEQLGLTSVATPTRLMGETAARCAIELITIRKPAKSACLPVRLVQRISSLAKR